MIIDHLDLCLSLHKTKIQICLLTLFSTTRFFGFHSIDIASNFRDIVVCSVYLYQSIPIFIITANYS